MGHHFSMPLYGELRETLEPNELDTKLAADADKIVRELNEQDASLVLGLATHLWPGARWAKFVGIKRDKFFVSATGISPIREEMYWPLDPPLESVEEALPRIRALKAEAFAPGVDSEPTTIFIALMALLFGTTYTSLSVFDPIKEALNFVLGEHTPLLLAFLVRFTVAIHALEATHAVMVAQRLGCSPAQTFGWALKTFLVGYGCLGRLRRIAFATELPGMETSGLHFIPYGEDAEEEEELPEVGATKKSEKAEEAVAEAAKEAAKEAPSGRFAVLNMPLGGEGGAALNKLAKEEEEGK